MRLLARLLAGAINLVTVLTGWIAAASLVAAALIVTEAVVVRKIFGVSTIWQIEASIFLLIFAVFSGAPFVQKNEHHLNVDLVLVFLSPRVREYTLVVVSVISALIAAFLAWYAWPMWWEAVVNNEHSESLWGPPLWIPYFFLPFGMSWLFLQYIIHIAQKIKALRQGDMKSNVDRIELRDIDLSEEKAGP